MSVAAGEWSSKRIAALPLAATLAFHLLLVLAWFARPVSHPADDNARPESILIQVPLPRLRSPAPPPPATVAEPVRTAVPAPVHPAVEAEPPAAPTTPTDSPPPAADNLPTARPSLKADDMLGAAKREAGKIDRELRAGKPGVPRVADTPMARFREGLASAHIDRSRTLAEESYTGADGITVYRFRRGDKVYCRTTGSVAAPMPGRTEGAVLAGAGRFDTLGKSSTSGTIECPGGEHDWVKR